MEEKVLLAKPIKEHMFTQLNTKISEIKQPLKLVVFQIEPTPESQIFLASKQRLANQLGILCEVIHYPISTSEEQIIARIEQANKDHSVTGIMIQKPIPSKYDYQNLIDHIEPKKDVEGVTKSQQQTQTLIAPTARSVLAFIEYYHIPIKDQTIVIIGRSNIVGMPLYQILHNQTQVYLCGHNTPNIQEIIQKGNLIIIAIGEKEWLRGDMINPNCTVIDVGTNYENNRIYGDVCWEEVYPKVQKITPVPKGVGALTSLMLMDNIVRAYSLQQESKK